MNRSFVVLVLLGAVVGLTVLLSSPVAAARTAVNIVDPGAHPLNPKCLDWPVSCNTDQECLDTCQEAVAMQCSEQDKDVQRGTVRKFCVPVAKPERPCDVSRGGRWLYTGWGQVDHSIDNDWECQCAFANVAGRVGCALNPDVCQGGVWEDGSWEWAAPDPTRCVCPSDTVRVIRDGVKPLCLPKSTVCFDAQSCQDVWNSS